LVILARVGWINRLMTVKLFGDVLQREAKGFRCGKKKERM